MAGTPGLTGPIPLIAKESRMPNVTEPGPKATPTAAVPVAPPTPAGMPDPVEDDGPKWKGGGKKGEDEPKDE